jgi:cobalamin biosynthesis Co2+ chelatase CbiK
MILLITSQSGQSMYDLCLASYGSIDLLLKFCNDNGVTDVNFIPLLPQVFEYDSTLIADQSNFVYAYTTGAIPTANNTQQFNLVTADKSQYLVTAGGSQYLNQA